MILIEKERECNCCSSSHSQGFFWKNFMVFVLRTFCVVKMNAFQILVAQLLVE